MTAELIAKSKVNEQQYSEDEYDEKLKQDVTIIRAIIKSPNRTRPSLGVGMTHMGQTLQTKRFRT